MAFAPGDRVQVVALGKGVIRDLRNGGRYLVEIKGRSLIVSGSQITAAAAPPAPRPGTPGRTESPEPPAARSTPSLDLHGKTVEEALDALAVFLNDALLDGSAVVRVIHGRSGGRLKAAVQARLKVLPPIRAFRLDPANPGVTIVTL